MAGVARRPPASYGRAVPAAGRRPLAAVLALARRQPAGPRDPAHRPPRGRLGARQVRVDAASGPSRRSTRSTAAPSAAAGRRSARAERCARRLPCQRVARRLLPPRRARPHVPGPERRGRGARPRPAPAPCRSVNERDPGMDALFRSLGRQPGALAVESSSPRGPAFQGERWDDPGAFAASARAAWRGAATSAASATAPELALAGGAGAAVLGRARAASAFGGSRRAARPEA